MTGDDLLAWYDYVTDRRIQTRLAAYPDSYSLSSETITMLRILLGCCSFLPFRGPGTEAVAPSSSSEFCYTFVV